MSDFLGMGEREAKYFMYGMITAFAAAFKLGAHLYRRTVLGWPSAFLVMLVTLLGAGFLGSLIPGAPFVVDLIFSLVVSVALGAVVLKFRAKTAEGQPLTNADAVKLSAISYGILTVVMGVFMGIMFAMGKAAAH